MSAGEIPWPLSEISITTASPSLSARVDTRNRRIGEPSIASAALSIRLATTWRISSGSAFTEEAHSARSVEHRDSVEPPLKKLSALATMEFRSAGGQARGGEARELRKFVDQGFECLHFALDQPRALGSQLFEFVRWAVGTFACCRPIQVTQSFAARKAEWASADS